MPTYKVFYAKKEFGFIKYFHSKKTSEMYANLILDVSEMGNIVSYFFFPQSLGVYSYFEIKMLT